MKLHKDKDRYRLSTGTTFYANDGILGICPLLEISEGYDGSIEEDKLTKEEKIELANYAISLWEKFRGQAGG